MSADTLAGTLADTLAGTLADTLFVAHTAETAPAQVRPHLTRAERQFGFIPGPLSRMASSPGLVEAFSAAQRTLEARARLGRLEREVVVMTVSAYNGCEYCVAMHTAILQGLQAAPALVEDLRQGRPLADPRLQALRAFTERVLATRGAAGEDCLRAFFAAGYDAGQALDVVLAIGASTLSTYANRLTGVPLDGAFAPFRWEAPRAGAI